MISTQLVKDLAKKIDTKVDWVKITGKAILGNALELADNFLLPQGLELLNEKYGDKIPVIYVDEIEEAIQAFINDDYQGVINALPEGLDDAIDIKFFDDDFEAVFIATNFNAVIKTITYYSKKKAA